MNKNIRNIIITAVISLAVGFVVGGVYSTGCCPITGKVICKDRVSACEKKALDACKTECEKKEASKEAGACETEKKESCCKNKNADAASLAPATEPTTKH